MVLVGLLTAALLTVLGPAAFAPADPLVLNRVEVRRVWNGWALSSFAPIGHIRIAVDDCNHIGHYCTIVIDETRCQCRVVDCLNEQDTPLEELGIVADVSLTTMGHLTGTVILWQEDTLLKSESRNNAMERGTYPFGQDGSSCTLRRVTEQEKLY